jgi:hypothetical protein
MLVETNIPAADAKAIKEALISHPMRDMKTSHKANANIATEILEALHCTNVWVPGFNSSMLLDMLNQATANYVPSRQLGI